MQPQSHLGFTKSGTPEFQRHFHNELILEVPGRLVCTDCRFSSQGLIGIFEGRVGRVGGRRGKKRRRGEKREVEGRKEERRGHEGRGEEEKRRKGRNHIVNVDKERIETQESEKEKEGGGWILP